MKKIFLAILLISFFAGYSVSLNAQEKFQQGRKHPEPGRSMEHQGIDKLFLFQAQFILMNQQPLSLSEEQVGMIKNLTLEVKKKLIKQKAEIGILKLDISARLSEPALNPEVIHQLIDQKYELKKVQDKSFVDAYAKLKSTLTADQNKKLKEIGMNQMTPRPQRQERRARQNPF